MPLLYSPIDGSELDGATQYFPKSAFLMIHDNPFVAAAEKRAQAIIREELAKSHFNVKAATDLKRSGDFLLKIIRMIQGCGFGIAVFSEATPARTLANIFFEVGYCLALGKPTQLVLVGDGEAPSDLSEASGSSSIQAMRKLSGTACGNSPPALTNMASISCRSPIRRRMQRSLYRNSHLSDSSGHT